MGRTRPAVAAALWLLAAPLAAQGRGAGNAVILMYHHVDATTPASTSVTPAVFRRHVEYLAAEGFSVEPLADLFEELAAGRPLPERTVALTFDDGYESVLSVAAPLLREHGWPFTVFVSTDAVDAGYGGYLGWAELRELEGYGATIANHTRSHAHLVQRGPNERRAEWERRVRDEIESAQRRIADEMGSAPPLLAYPYGELDADVERIVADLGYYAVGQQSGAVAAYSNLRAAPRFPMATGYDGMQEFRLRVRARALPLVEPRVPAAVLGPETGDRPAFRFELGPGPYRAAELACYASGQGMMTLMPLDDRRFEARPRRPIGPGRTKYNCTAPSSVEDGVYYWASFLWMKRNADGSWYTD